MCSDIVYGLDCYSQTLQVPNIQDCGPLVNPENGQVNISSGTTFGSTATYTCNTGYTLSGPQSRTCGADGNWIFSEPFCEGMYMFCDKNLTDFRVHCIMRFTL